MYCCLILLLILFLLFIKGTQHSFSEEEKLAFVDWINFQLENDPEMSAALPIEEDGDGLFRAVYDGLVMW